MNTELVYFGFVISSNELKMDPEKVREEIGLLQDVYLR
jgi:hypothetical protein